MNFRVLQRFLPPINIHIWGGLGSQLFACVVGRRLEGYFPYRRIRLCFHTSGVTRRSLELPQRLLSGYFVKIIDDFKGEPSVGSPQNRLQHLKVKSKLKVVLTKLGFLVQLNTQTEFLSLSKRVLEVRGHYSQIRLEQDEISWLFDNLVTWDIREEFISKTSFHYRLGDLLTLASKSPIETGRIVEEINKLPELEELFIISDSSIDDVRKLLKQVSSKIIINSQKGSTANDISACFHSLVFIGTNSKISTWIAVFRLSFQVEGSTIMPAESCEHLKQILPHSANLTRLFTY